MSFCVHPKKFPDFKKFPPKYEILNSWGQNRPQGTKLSWKDNQYAEIGPKERNPETFQISISRKNSGKFSGEKEFRNSELEINFSDQN